MKYNDLQLKTQKKATRPGRGISAGRGKTAGRGTKGQGSRKSGGVRPGFEGGQMPLYMRLPHLKGFKSHRQRAETIYTGQLESFKKATVNNDSLFEAGLITSPHNSVKLLLKGELKQKKDVKLQAASKSAIEALQSAGGSFEGVERQKRLPKKANDKIK